MERLTRENQRVSELRDQLAGITAETFSLLQEKIQENIRLQRENTRQASTVAHLQEENTRYKGECFLESFLAAKKMFQHSELVS